MSQNKHKSLTSISSNKYIKTAQMDMHHKYISTELWKSGERVHIHYIIYNPYCTTNFQKILTSMNMNKPNLLAASKYNKIPVL